MSENIPLVGFAPDLDQTTPGIITDCTMMYPTVRGYKGGASLTDLGYPALASECRGAAVCTILDGTSRMFSSVQTALYEASTAAWTDVSKGGGYTGSADSLWRFAVFGNDVYATNKADTLQKSSGAAFADDTSALKASLIESVNGFLFVADTNEGTYGDQSDRWWCSAYMSGFTGTPDVTTQETTGRLVEVSGPIRGIKRLGNDIVIYKKRGMWLGRYVGAPSVWQFSLIPGEIGCNSQEAIISIGSAHIFVGYEDIYLFDGTRPVSIGAGIKEWFFTELNLAYAYNIKGLHDREKSLVYIFYPTGAQNATCDACIVYNYKVNKWGRCDRAVECAAEFLSGQVTYDSFGDFFATWEDIPAISYDSPFFSQSSPLQIVFDTTHTAKSMTGASATSSFTTGDMGDNYQFSTFERMRVRCKASPTSATMTNYYRNVLGDSLTTDATATMTDGRFDVLRSARWHRAKFDFVGDVEVQSFQPSLVQDGFE